MVGRGFTSAEDHDIWYAILNLTLTPLLLSSKQCRAEDYMQHRCIIYWMLPRGHLTSKTSRDFERVTIRNVAYEFRLGGGMSLDL